MWKVEAPSALHDVAEPGVINGNILISLAIEQGPQKEAGRLFLKDGLELTQLTEIRIEFLNILNIDYLWLLKNLVKLSLAHNVIEIIENLDELVHLRELDLSFNRIKVIENLNHLDQLEILLLYSNEISIVQGIEKLKKLVILNIGKNKITDWEHVIYLRKFKLLRSLNTWDNPCAEIDGYLDYLYAFMPQLLYYKYKMISEDMRQSAIDKHYNAVKKIEEQEAKIEAELELQQKLEEKIALLSLSYVEYLDEDSLFQQMFAFDKEGKALSQVNEDTKEAIEEYRQSFSVISNQLYKLGLQEHNKRMEEVRLFEVAVNEGKDNTRNKTRKIVDEVLENKVEMFANIKSVMEALIEENEETADDTAAKARELLNEFDELLSKARFRMMSKEMILHDQLEDINDVIRYNLSDMVSAFLDDARLYFSNMRNAEAEYNDNINAIISYYLSGLEDETHVPEHLVDVCGGKEVLTTNLAASHDTHLQVIDDREESMINRLNNWVKEYSDQLVIDEFERHRQQILEISHFFGFQRQELSKIGLAQPELMDIELDMDDD